jgi:hypothetical protein
MRRRLALKLIVAATFRVPAFTQPAALSPPELDQLVARIALYPDPLLAQILTASTYWSEIPEAAAWANQHSYLKGDALATHDSMEDNAVLRAQLARSVFGDN